MKKIFFAVILYLLLTACSSTKTTQGCYGCNVSKHTVRKPVEIVYEDTTYTTVYEPRTYTTKSYVRKPYNYCEKENICK